MTLYKDGHAPRNITDAATVKYYEDNGWTAGPDVGESTPAPLPLISDLSVREAKAIIARVSGDREALLSILKEEMEGKNRSGITGAVEGLMPVPEPLPDGENLNTNQ